jgi:hypothetical protein
MPPTQLTTLNLNRRPPALVGAPQMSSPASMLGRTSASSKMYFASRMRTSHSFGQDCQAFTSKQNTTVAASRTSLIGNLVSKESLRSLSIYVGASK